MMSMINCPNDKMTEGARVEWLNERGWTERGVVTQQYKSAMGHWCLEMTNGVRIKVSEARVCSH